MPYYFKTVYFLTMVNDQIKRKVLILLLIISAACPMQILSEPINSLIHQIGKNEVKQTAKLRIFSKDDVLFCTGTDRAGELNNRAAEMMKEGKYADAEKLLLQGLKHAPLFFPYHYNAGICNLYLHRLSRALMYLNKAIQIVPEYSDTYLQIGYIYGRMNKESNALEFFREALRLNPRELNTYVLVGDIYFQRDQLATAEKYYDAALKVKNTFPNGQLGKAKINFKNEKYSRAIIWLKSIDISRGDYDKSLHYYFAESAFKTGDYKTAVQQYEKLLQFKNDRFFLKNSLLLIRHKLDLSKRFTER